LFLKKFRPFKGVPAGTEERTMGDSVLMELLLRPWPAGVAAKGVVKGWVAVDEAERGSDGVGDCVGAVAERD